MQNMSAKNRLMVLAFVPSVLPIQCFDLSHTSPMEEMLSAPHSLVQCSAMQSSRLFGTYGRQLLSSGLHGSPQN